MQCASGAVNTQGFEWTFSCAMYIFIHSFMNGNSHMEHKNFHTAPKAHSAYTTELYMYKHITSR